MEARPFYSIYYRSDHWGSIRTCASRCRNPIMPDRYWGNYWFAFSPTGIDADDSQRLLMSAVRAAIVLPGYTDNEKTTQS